VLLGLLIELDLAAGVCFGRREEPVVRSNGSGRDQSVVEQAADVGVDALALVEPVVQEQRVHVGLPGAVWCFTEVALLVHGFAEVA
jgi:hypothetical protein